MRVLLWCILSAFLTFADAATVKAERPDTIASVMAEIQKIDQQIAKYEAMVVKYRDNRSATAKRLVKLAQTTIANLQLQRVNSQTILRNLQKIQKLEQRMKEAQKLLGPTQFRVPTLSLTKSCRTPVVRFFRHISAIWINEMYKPKTERGMRHRRQYTIVSSVSNALYVLDINKRWITCFEQHPSLPPQRRRYVAYATKYLAQRGLKNQVQASCQKTFAEEKACKSRHKDDPLICDMMGLAFTCRSQIIRTWLAK